MILHVNGGLGKTEVAGATMAAGNGNVVEGKTGNYRDLANRSVKDGMTPDHIPSYASVEKSLRDAGYELSPEDLKELRNNTSCVVVKTCDHQSYSRTYGGRNSTSQISSDSINLYSAAEKNLAIWEQVWKNKNWSDQEIKQVKTEIHRIFFESKGIKYEP